MSRIMNVESARNVVPTDWRGKMSMALIIGLIASLVTASPTQASPSSAPSSHYGAPTSGQPNAVSTFTPGFIIADENFYSHSAMSESEIQAFLDARIGSCRTTTCLNVLRVNMPSYAAAFSTTTGAQLCSAVTGGSALRASTIIFRVQQACGVSARVILVTLQKEQGLVTSKEPSSYALSYAMGWACPDSTGCVDPNSQFGFQVYRGARQLVTYKLANFARQPGTHQIAFSPSPGCGSTSVRIVNHATAALYNYTPYQPTAAAIAAWPSAVSPYSPCNSYGNRNFWFFYNQWFGNPTAVLPGAPLAPIVGENNGVVLSLSWAPPVSNGTSPVTGYYVEYRRSTSSTWNRVAGSPIPATNYTFVRPSLGVSFDFRIRGANRFGTGAPSPLLTVLTPPPPGAPESLTAAVNDGAELRLEWQPPTSAETSPVTDYAIQYKRSTSSTWKTVSDGVNTNTTFTFLRPSAGVTFDFRVRARTGSGWSAFTAPIRVTTPSGKPSAPESLAATVNDGAQLMLDWKPPLSSGSSPVTDYAIQYRRSTSTTWVTVSDGVSTKPTFTFFRPSAGVTFDFRVRARNSSGWGSWTPSLRETIPASQ